LQKRVKFHLRTEWKLPIANHEFEKRVFFYYSEKSAREKENLQRGSRRCFSSWMTVKKKRAS